MMTSILTVLLVCICLAGCGGGGGSDASNTSDGNPTDEGARAQAFVEEAIRLAMEDALVTCQTVVCPIADADTETERPDGVVVHGCTWECMESVIDDSGETRNHFIIVSWVRFSDGCFEPPEVLLAQESPVLCVPNQVRF
jgi:hypothetical protein